MSEAATVQDAAPDAGPEDVRPVVRTAAASNLGLWIFVAILLIGGLSLFMALNTRRQNLDAPGTLPGGQGGGMIAAPSPLSLPGSYTEYAFDDDLRRIPVRLAPPDPAINIPPQAITRVNQPSQPALNQNDMLELGLLRPPPSAPQYVPPPTENFAAIPAQFDAAERVSAGRLANPSFTVPKGTIVAAVLETALDSSRPGAVRAIVSRDVRSFDGSRVLIPRGSRIYGEYEADVSAGQNRALIRWERLTRPDAVVINLDSPSADPLGRAGVRGKVNSHFFARFGGAILQSVLDIGVGLATRSLTNDSDQSVVVALPGSTQQVTGQLMQPTQVQPTLRVRQGTSVSVFVARDLDFSTTDG